MKTLVIDCTCGISGDMFAGAMLMLTGAEEALRAEIEKLPLKGCVIQTGEAERGGIRGRRFMVHAPDEQPHRHYADIVDMLRASDIGTETLRLSLDMFRTLAEAESRAHRVPIEQVHFHEVGAVDSIVDMVSAAFLVQHLAPEQVLCGPVRVGRGTISFSHGETNLPVPAVREILKDWPMQAVDIPRELTTPTGAAIVKTIAAHCDPLPTIAGAAEGIGAGARDLDVPNVLTVRCGDAPETPRTMIMLETHIDDMNPELYPVVVDRLVERGAVDAYAEPCAMKKGRVGMVLHVIARTEQRDEMVETIFNETSTFGIRINRFQRAELDRTVHSVETSYGRIRVKSGSWKGDVRTVSPEFEDCLKASNEHGVPVRKVYDEAVSVSCQ